MDQKDQKLVYEYDSGSRVEYLKKYPSAAPRSGNTWTEDTQQRVRYYYDGAVPSSGFSAYTAEGPGRVTAASYSSGGRDFTHLYDITRRAA